MFTLRLITRSPTAAAQNNSKGICQRCVSSCRADFSQPSNQTTSNFFLLYAIVIADLTDCCLPRHQQLFKKLSFHARFELQFYFLDRFGSTWRKRKEKGESVSLPQWWRSNPSSFFPCKFLDLVAIVSTKYNAKQKWPHRELVFAQPLEHCGCVTTALKGVCEKMAKKNSQKGM